MRISPRRRETPDVSLTPLIDVVFLLLIFFMVSTTFERQSELGIELPQATATEEPTQRQPLEITVDARGRFYLNGRPLVNTQRETLVQALRDAVQGRRQTPLVINADAKAPVQAMIAVMDAARELGLTRLRFPTQLAEPEQAGN